MTKSEQKLQDKRLLIKSRIDKLPNFKNLTHCPPNPDLIALLINIMYGGSFILRLYNGDLSNNSDEAMGSLINVSKCLYLEPKLQVGSIENALEFAFEASIACEGLPIAKGFNELILEDLIQIFKNKFFGFEVFFKIYDLCHQIENKEDFGEKKKVMNKIKQKLIFFMSFYKSEQPFSSLQILREKVLLFLNLI